MPPKVGLLDKLSDWGWQTALAVGSAAVGWVFYMERRMAGLRLHVAENYVRKTDLLELKQDIAKQFQEVKEGNSLILDVLMERKIGTKRIGR